MAPKKKRDNVKTTSPDGGATRKYSNPDLAKRLANYGNRTGEYAGKKGGAKFTQPVEGKPTGNRARGAQQAKEWGDQKRVSQGRSIYDTAPAISRGNGNRPAGTVRNPSPSMFGPGSQGRPPQGGSGGGGYTGPGIPTQPMGAPPRDAGNYRPTPLVRTQQPLVYAPSGPLSQDGYGGGGIVGDQSYRRTGDLQTSPPVGYQPPGMFNSSGSIGEPPPGYQPPPGAQQTYLPMFNRQPGMPQSSMPGMPPQGNLPQYTAEEIQQLLQMMNGGGGIPPRTPWGRKW